MADYVRELAEETFRKLGSGKGPLLEKVLDSSFEARPPDPGSLAGELESRADVQARLASLTGYTPSKWLLERELDQVEMRRAKVNMKPPDPPLDPGADTYQRATELGLMGLCFSGGGIRSATFNLGILQGLAELKLLRCFDYLSTVSGGGYIHQWFAAWSKRWGFEEVEKRLIPLPEPHNPGDHPEPIRWLRRYSNYLTPENGLLSGDTWVAIATWLRNTLLNQIILFSGLLLVALVLRWLASPRIAPHSPPAVAAFVGAIFYLTLQAAYLIGENLVSFSRESAGEPRAYGQQGVIRWIVLPLTVSAMLLTLLLPFAMADMFGINLALICLASAFLLLALSLTVALAGGAPLCYLQTHHRTSQYKKVSDFWNQPKCFAHLKFVFVMLGLFSVCAISAVAGAASIGGSIVLLGKLYHISPHYWWRLVLVAGPPLTLAGPLVAILLVIGLLGRMFDDGRREWLTRLAGCIGLIILLWILSFGSSLFGHSAVVWLWVKWQRGVPALTVWAAATIRGLLAGKSSKSNGAESDEPSGLSEVEIAAVVGPYVFIAGLLLLISAAADTVFHRASMAGPWYLFCTYLAAVLICVIFAWRVDINEFSLHAFYRNRLARCYLGASNIPRHPNRFTGFDETDTNIPLSELLSDARPGKGYNGPFPIFCTTLNLTFGEDLAWQDRKGASFAFTPLYSGYDLPWTEARGPEALRFNGFVETAKYAYTHPGVHIDTVAAISGAAMSPNMGYHSNPATAFLMTVFDVRLGWWLCNPRRLNEDGTKLGTEDCYPWPSPHLSLLYLVYELLGRTNDTSNYVYLSDGGHFDNMGLYELVRRRCRYIVICDSEADGDLKFEGIGMAIRKCRIDFGAEVALGLRPLQHMKDSQDSSAHCVVGTITYPEDPGTTGVVVYIKSSLTGDEPADVLNYKKQDPVFPHDSTTDQWFTESQFESYRRLGHHVALSVFEPASSNAADFACATISGRQQYFENLRSIWWASTPEMDRFSAAHTERYNILLEKARTDENLPGFFDMMFGAGSDWKKGRTPERIDYAVQFSSGLIEFVFVVFNQLDLRLPEKRAHPYVRGWSPIFTKWTKIDVVQDAWKRYRDSYSSSFRRFAESDIVGLPEVTD
ncbi:MAG: acyltransferase [Candidatus Sulfotelmatobacter sp.]